MSTKRKTLAETARMNVVSTILAQCHQFADASGSEPVAEAVRSLDELGDLSSEQVSQTIGLIDGNLELNSRYANLAKAERQAVADEMGFENTDEVCNNKARSFNGGTFDASLKQVRARLAAVYDLLVAAPTPASAKDMISVPTGSLGSTGKSQTSRSADTFDRRG